MSAGTDVSIGPSSCHCQLIPTFGRHQELPLGAPGDDGDDGAAVVGRALVRLGVCDDVVGGRAVRVDGGDPPGPAVVPRPVVFGGVVRCVVAIGAVGVTVPGGRPVVVDRAGAVLDVTAVGMDDAARPDEPANADAAAVDDPGIDGPADVGALLEPALPEAVADVLRTVGFVRPVLEHPATAAMSTKPTSSGRCHGRGRNPAARPARLPRGHRRITEP